MIAKYEYVIIVPYVLYVCVRILVNIKKFPSERNCLKEIDRESRMLIFKILFALISNKLCGLYI
jgi:hypothetical protein